MVLLLESWVDELNSRWIFVFFFVLGIFIMIGQICIGLVVCNFLGYFLELDVKYGNFRCFIVIYFGESLFKVLFMILMVFSDFEEDKMYV